MHIQNVCQTHYPTFVPYWGQVQFRDNKKTNFIEVSFLWCGQWDLNPYGCPHGPQPCASADSAMAAYTIDRFLPT